MADTSFEGVVDKFILCLILALATPGTASDLVSPAHFFPIARHTDGLAGTQWTTTVRIANPHQHPLTITARLSTAGSFLTETLVLPPKSTVGWSDFLDDVFGFEGNGAVLLEAEAASNPEAPDDQLEFAAFMRISTVADSGGSYGQGVPSLDPITGFLGDWIAMFPAVRLHGQPGVDGFRTNVGFWNVGTDPAEMRLTILDADGTPVWQDTITADRHVPFVAALPRNLELETATLTVEPISGWLDCAVYISVVDNLTGDATFVASQLVDLDAQQVQVTRAMGDDPRRFERDQTAQRMRDLFLGHDR
jgi:hypothetical protein